MTVELVSALLERIATLEAELKKLRPQTAALLKPFQGKGSDVEISDISNECGEWVFDSKPSLQSP